MKNSIVDYLKKYLLGKQLSSEETHYCLDELKIKGFFQNEMILSDLSLSENGFQFNFHIITKEKCYHIDKNRKETLQKDYTACSVFHYSFAHRKSTDRISGIMSLQNSSIKDHVLEAINFEIDDCDLNNKELKWMERQNLYRDMQEESDHFLPIYSEADIRFYLEGNLACMAYTPRFFRYSKDNSERKIIESPVPGFVCKEKER